MTVKIQLAQHALHLGAEFKRMESELEQKKVQSEAAGMAFKRSLNFASALGTDFACPDCWVRHGNQVAIAPIPSGDGDDLFRCKDCRTELTVHV